MDALDGATWFKSTRSGGSGNNCVEVAIAKAVVGVRHSKDRSGPALRFAPAAWTTFTGAVKAGEFDLS